MLRSLYSGVSGVKAQQASLDVIGNNIANVNTTGFKAARITFADALSETISGAKGTAGNLTGANPIQIGRGVLISSIDTNFKQGSVDATSILTDIAINGKGFFIATDGQRKYYTRAGGFQILDDGSVMAQGGNYHIMGRLADSSGKLPSTTALENLSLPFGRKEPAKATSNIDVYCNLDNAASKTEEWLGKDALLTIGKPVSLETDLALIDGSNILLGDEIEITGTDRLGKKILDPDHKEYTFTYGKDGTTVQDLINRINYVFNSTNAESGATVTLDQAGRLRLEANMMGETEFSIFLVGKTTGNHVATHETRSTTEPLIALNPNKINQLSGGDPSMGYMPQDIVEITYNGVMKEFHFANSDVTLQDIANWINDSFEGANVVLAPGGSNNTVVFKDIVNPARTVTFANSTGPSGSTGLDAQTEFELTSDHVLAYASNDLRFLMNSTIGNGKTILIEGTTPDGTYVSGTFTYGLENDGITIQHLLNKISKVFMNATATLNEKGEITITDNAPGDSKSTIKLSSGSAVGWDMKFQTEIFTANNELRINATNTPPVAATLINDLRTTYMTPYQTGDVIKIMASQMDGQTKTVNFRFGDPLDGYDGTTLGELVYKINNSNEFPGLTASLNTNGQIVFTDSSVNDDFNYTSIQITNAPGTIGSGLESHFATNAGTSRSAIIVPTFSPVQEGVTGKHHSAITVYDSSGHAHRVDIYYTQDLVPGSNKWFWEIMIDEGKTVATSGGSGYVMFNENGSLRTFNYDNGTQLRFNVLGGEEVKINLNPGTPGSYNGMTSTDAPSTNILIEQDGYPMGTLATLNIDDHGIINGIYTNGVTKTLAQIALANFTNEGGLMREGNNLFSSNASSGTPIVTWAGTNNDTRLKSGYLEASNVDLTDEFSKMIIAQRSLEANAKVITTADTVLTTIIERMKR